MRNAPQVLYRELVEACSYSILVSASVSFLDRFKTF